MTSGYSRQRPTGTARLSSTTPLLTEKGPPLTGSQSLTLVPVNDAPVVCGVVDLGSMEEDGTFRITSEQLLAKASDVDGDELSVLNLKVAEGEGTITGNADGTWTFAPSADWNGPVRFSYDVSDGHGNTNVAPPINAIARNGSFYVVVDGPTWEQAEANAQKLGGHLVTINDAEENAWLFETFNITGPSYPSGKDSYWAGFSDAEQEGIWKWSSGEQTTYTNWQPGEPNNWQGHGDEDHLVLGRYGKGGKWNDANTNVEAKKGIAEIKAPAAGGTPAQAELDVEPGNDAPTINPELTALLDDNLEDTTYTIRQSDLLAGASDPDGDSLSAINLKVTEGQGEIVNNNDGTWTFKPTLNFNGDVAFSYDITDGNGAAIATDQSFFLEPVNDAPVVSGVVDLGSMEEDGTFRITSEQLLARASDVDGDELSVLNLKVAEGQGAITDNNDGTWTFKPSADWNGEVEFSYGVSDGSEGSASSTQWLRYHATQLAEHSGGIAALSNGDYVKAFSSQMPDGTSAVMVQRLSSDGELRWSIDIEADEFPGAGSILVNQDDTIFVVGGTKQGKSGESGKNDSDVFATAISANGNQLWYQNYGIGLHEIGANGTLDGSGNLLLNGRVSEVNDAYHFIKDVSDFYGADFTGGWKGFQLRLNPTDGTVDKAYTTGSRNSGGNGVASDASRNISFVHGYTFGAVNGVGTIGNGDPGGANHYLLARDEGSGEVLWTRMDNWIQSNVAVSEAEGAVYFVDKGQLEKVSTSTGKTLWSKSVDSTGYTLTAAKSGGVLLAKSNSSHELLIQQVTTDGDFAKTERLSHQGTLNTRQIIETTDGSLLIAGSASEALSVDDQTKVLNQPVGGFDAFTLKLNNPFAGSEASNSTVFTVNAKADLTVTPINDAPSINPELSALLDDGQKTPLTPSAKATC